MWQKPCWWMKLWFYNLGGKQLMSMKWSQLNKEQNWKKNENGYSTILIKK